MTAILAYARVILFGAGLGTLLAYRWSLALAEPGATSPLPLMAIPLAIAAIALAAQLAVRAGPVAADTAVAPLAALALVIVLHAVMHLRVMQTSIHPGVPVPPAAAVPVMLILWAIAARRASVWVAAGVTSLVAATPATPWAHLSGEHLAAVATDYQPFSLTPLLPTATALALLIAAAGPIAAYLTARPLASTAARFAALGVGASLTMVDLHVVALVTAMGTGGDPAAVWTTLALHSALFCAAILAAMRAWSDPRGATLARLAPAVVLFLSLGVIIPRCQGARDYLSLARYHGGPGYTYIHFRSDGSQARTLEQCSAEAKVWRCNAFLAAYPASAYRPAALLALAQTQIDTWNYADAAETLDRVVHDYPSLNGDTAALRAIAHLGAGFPHAILAPVDPATSYAAWRRADGALLAAAAAHRLGQPYRALGHYAAYEASLASRHTSWAQASLNFSRHRSREVIAHLKSSQPLARTATVTARLSGPTGPIANARLILVQPHVDAALLADSRQFTGAWTVPAWNGAWAATDRDGRATIRAVPYGDYEIVLGLPPRTTRRGLVVARNLPRVTIDHPAVTLPTVHLTHPIRLASPRPSQRIDPGSFLRWQPHPGATHYSATVVMLAPPPNSSPSLRRDYAGRTCWTRNHIATPYTPIGTEHFVNGHKRLEPGATYMWVVRAFDPNGEVLSSSEHYYDLREPTFTVRMQAAHSEEAKAPELAPDRVMTTKEEHTHETQ